MLYMTLIRVDARHTACAGLIQRRVPHENAIDRRSPVIWCELGLKELKDDISIVVFLRSHKIVFRMHIEFVYCQLFTFEGSDNFYPFWSELVFISTVIFVIVKDCHLTQNPHALLGRSSKFCMTRPIPMQA